MALRLALRGVKLQTLQNFLYLYINRSFFIKVNFIFIENNVVFVVCSSERGLRNDKSGGTA